MPAVQTQCEKNEIENSGDEIQFSNIPLLDRLKPFVSCSFSAHSLQSSQLQSRRSSLRSGQNFLGPGAGPHALLWAPSSPHRHTATPESHTHIGVVMDTKHSRQSFVYDNSWWLHQQDGWIWDVNRGPKSQKVTTCRQYSHDFYVHLNWASDTQVEVPNEQLDV